MVADQIVSSTVHPQVTVNLRECAALYVTWGCTALAYGVVWVKYIDLVPPARQTDNRCVASKGMACSARM